MRHAAETLEFEEPIAVLLKEIEALELLPARDAPRARVAVAPAAPGVGAGRPLRVAHAVAARAGRAAPEPSRSRGLHPAAVHRLRRDPRRPPLRRRSRHHDAASPTTTASPCCVVGHVKGRDTKEKIFRNFGYARPEGYRKALRAMRLAEKFQRADPRFVDTPAAYPGIESEERGVAEAIAVNLRDMMLLDDADRRRRQRRGRQRRRARHRDRRSGADAGVRDLQRDPARGLRRHPVARRGEEGRGGRGAEAHGAGSARRGIIDEIVPRAGRRRAHRSRRGRAPRRRGARSGPREVSRARQRARRLEQRYEKFRNMGRLGIDFVDDSVDLIRLTTVPRCRTRPSPMGCHCACDDAPAAERLAAALGVPPVVARLLCQRGLGDPETAPRAS